MMYSGLVLFIVIGVTACAPLSAPTATAAQPDFSTEFSFTKPPREATLTTVATALVTVAIPVTGPLMKPAEVAPEIGKLTTDVVSSGEAAPYGDSYRTNRFERPFTRDMTYIPDLDIIAFTLSEDTDWQYISIKLNGDDPNNSIGINYGVEIDLNADGVGDYILWAHPPYTTQWDNSTVQVFEDSDQDSAGPSSRESDAVFDGNGYDTLAFDGGNGQYSDLDMVWVRMRDGEQAIVQFAFKKSWISSSFMIGVISDAGLKDVSRFDYNDKFNEADAGSPVHNNPNYPLGSLYAVDNTCWQGHGVKTIVYQPKFCPTETLPTPTQKPPSDILPTNPAPGLGSTIPPFTRTNPPPATNTEPPPGTNTEPPPATNTEPPPATNTDPPPANTEFVPLPPPPEDTACTPDPDLNPDDCENGYNPETCQCRGG